MREPRFPSARAALSRALRIARDSWSVIGLSLLLLAGLEAGSRIAPSAPRRARDLPDPLEASDWFPAFVAARAGHVCCEHTVFDPYRSWWGTPGEHEGLHVGEDGYRVTVSRAEAKGAASREVFLFGGSAMWGYTARDAATIPSRVAERLEREGLSEIAVRNKSQSAFNLTQNVATLMLELRSGARPTAVVFLDGVNEVGPVAEGEPVGGVYGQRNAAQRLRIDSTSDLIRQLFSRLAIVERLGLSRPTRASAAVDARSVCPEVGEAYANLARTVGAMGREFGFVPQFFFQPTLAMSKKRRGPWEHELMRGGGYLGSPIRPFSRRLRLRIAS